MITAGTTLSFLADVLRGVHQPDDRYALALYASSASLSPDTEAYTTDGEVIGSPGYTAGGQVLSGFTVQSVPGGAILDFDDPIWPRASISARGALIYNQSRRNKSVVVIDFGANIVSTNGRFLVTLPDPTVDGALIFIGV